VLSLSDPEGFFRCQRERITEMQTKSQDLDHRIIDRYADQPVRLPADLRARIERAFGNMPVQLYALADLNHAHRLAETWVALGPDHLAIAHRVDAGTPGGKDRTNVLPSAGEWQIDLVERAQIDGLHEEPGLSATTLTVLASAGRPPLAVLRYSNRQRRAVENLRYVLEEQLGGRTVPPADPDAEYADGVARPIRETQSLVSGRKGAVIRRLLGYLGPYRRELALGMSAAGVITLVSIAPPYIAGALIDRVIRPAQQGAMPLERATTIAWLAVGAMALVYLIREAAGLVRLRLMSVLGEWVARDLRAALYEHIQRLSLSFFSRK
jgi:ATP-binding cassette subfamily B protein